MEKEDILRMMEAAMMETGLNNRKQDLESRYIPMEILLKGISKMGNSMEKANLLGQMENLSQVSGKMEC